MQARLMPLGLDPSRRRAKSAAPQDEGRECAQDRFGKSGLSSFRDAPLRREPGIHFSTRKFGL